MSKQVQQSSEHTLRTVCTGKRLPPTDGKAPIITVSDLTNELRKTIGTPFHYGGRVPGLDGGLDCVGVLVIALQNLGYEITDKERYNRGDGLVDMLELLAINNFSQKEQDAIPEAGDVMLIRYGPTYHHLVYLTEYDTIIHSWLTTGVNKVVESGMLPEWWTGLHSIWRFGCLE